MTNAIKIWIIVSFAMIVLSYGFSAYEPTIYLRLGGLISSLLAVGYYVCSPSTTIRKVSYAGVVIIAFGVAFKILHWTGANESIIVGLFLFGVPYVIEFFRRKPDDQRPTK